jgi:hypothetical protein
LTLEEIWLTLTGHPDKAARTARKDGPGREIEDPRVEMLDWTTTDSPSELKQRAERAAKAATADE